MKTIATLLASLGLILQSNFAVAYEIGSGSIAKAAFNVHETLTALAMDCLTQQIRPPFDCRSKYAQLQSKVRQAITSPSDPTYFVRWPDDPLRMLERDRSKLTYGMLLKRICQKEMMDRDTPVNVSGVLCASHFGRLSFLHSMATPNQSELDPAGTTRSLVLDWTDLVFDVAVSEKVRVNGYCREMLERGRLGQQLKISESWCKKRNPWLVQTLFAFRCHKLIFIRRCSELTKEAGREAAIAAARGALLHVIQDSYSQSHVRRSSSWVTASSETGPFAPFIVCGPIEQFYNYTEQDSELHGVSDKPPILDKSCTDGVSSIDDPITASATALYYLANPDKRAALQTYLACRVFPLAGRDLRAEPHPCELSSAAANRS